MAEGEPVTRSEWVTRRLRAAILSGEFRPGERLLTPDLTRRFSVSPTPLREALQALASEGIVEWTPQRGARVAPVSLDEYRELHELSLAIEPMAVALSLKNGGAAWLADVEAGFAEYRRVLRSGATSIAELEEAHRNFHSSVISGCGNAWLIRLNQLLLQGSARYRSAAFRLVKRTSCLETADRLVQACRERAEPDAQEATRADIDGHDVGPGRFRRMAGGAAVTGLSASTPTSCSKAPSPSPSSCSAENRLTVDDITHFELHEAFATPICAWLKVHRADPTRVNPDGGAIAIGHPFGASGARQLAHLAHRLHGKPGSYGLQAMCAGGGIGTGTLLLGAEFQNGA